MTSIFVLADKIGVFKSGLKQTYCIRISGLGGAIDIKYEADESYCLDTHKTGTQPLFLFDEKSEIHSW